MSTTHPLERRTLHDAHVIRCERAWAGRLPALKPTTHTHTRRITAAPSTDQRGRSGGGRRDAAPPPSAAPPSSLAAPIRGQGRGSDRRGRARSARWRVGGCVAGGWRHDMEMGMGMEIETEMQLREGKGQRRRSACNGKVRATANGAGAAAAAGPWGRGVVRQGVGQGHWSASSRRKR